MRPNTRYMIQKIADGRFGLMPLLYMIYQQPNCDLIFQRLIDNKIIGEKFGQVLGECHHDLPTMINNIMR